MEVILENISKRFINEWVFKNISITINDGSKWAIVGPNGSGKSTLLQIISAFRLPSAGEISFVSNGKKIPADVVYSSISFASPYLELIEEFTLKEQVEFHYTWRKSILDFNNVIELFHLEKAYNKQIKYFSSGMKQRLKLALAFGTDSELLLLDEPTANLDTAGIDVYFQCLEKLLNKRTLVIASNDKEEYKVCDRHLNIMSYKHNLA